MNAALVTKASNNNDKFLCFRLLQTESEAIFATSGLKAMINTRPEFPRSSREQEKHHFPVLISQPLNHSILFVFRKNMFCYEVKPAGLLNATRYSSLKIK